MLDSYASLVKIRRQVFEEVARLAYEGGDYKRTERMRDVIAAMVEKLKTKSGIFDFTKNNSSNFRPTLCGEKWVGELKRGVV